MTIISRHDDAVRAALTLTELHRGCIHKPFWQVNTLHFRCSWLCHTRPFQHRKRQMQPTCESGSFKLKKNNQCEVLQICLWQKLVETPNNLWKFRGKKKSQNTKKPLWLSHSEPAHFQKVWKQQAAFSSTTTTKVLWQKKILVSCHYLWLIVTQLALSKPGIGTITGPLRDNRVPSTGRWAKPPRLQPCTHALQLFSTVGGSFEVWRLFDLCQLARFPSQLARVSSIHPKSAGSAGWDGGVKATHHQSAG